MNRIGRVFWVMPKTFRVSEADGLTTTFSAVGDTEWNTINYCNTMFTAIRPLAVDVRATSSLLMASVSGFERLWF